MKIDPLMVVLKNGINLVLRSASPLDAENMLKHLRESHAESYKNLNQSAEYWNGVSVADEEKILTEFETSPRKFLLVALHDHHIIGGLGLTGHLAEFSRKNASLGMSIQSHFQGLGLGSALMKHALFLAKTMDFHRLDLTVRTYNLPAIKLYERCGFTRVGLLTEVAFIDGHYVDEYSYQLIL